MIKSARGSGACYLEVLKLRPSAIAGNVISLFIFEHSTFSRRKTKLHEKENFAPVFEQWGDVPHVPHVPPVPKSTSVIMNYRKAFSREKHCTPIFLYESGPQLLKK